MAESYTFEDVESVERPGYVRVVVPAVKGLWLMLRKENYLIFHENHGALNQLFKVHFLARDVVAIESHIGGCLKFDEDDEKFILSECNYLTNFKNQTFLITNVDGKWFGHGSTKEGWGLPIEDQIAWGMCETCVPGGFGSEEQGKDFDKDVASGQYIAEINTREGSVGSETNVYTTNIINPFSFRYKTYDELEKGMPYDKNNFIPSTFIKKKESQQSSRDAKLDDETYSNFAKTGQTLDMLHRDSFGNEMKSEDHHLDEVFDHLSTDAKKDALNLAGIWTGDRNVYSVKKWPHNQTTPVGDITLGFEHHWE